MSSNFSLPENLKLVNMIPNQVGNGAVTGDYVSLKNAHKAWIVVDFTEGGAETIVLQPVKATAVAPTGSTNITNAVKIWSNLATAASDTLVERTAATSYTTNNVATNKLIVFEIDPADLGETYDVISITATAPNAGDYISAVCYIQPRYASQVSMSPTAITD